MSTFGERLRELRNEKELTLDELKDYLNTTKATLSRYENDKRDPKIEFANKVAKFFDVSLDYMLGVTNNRAISDTSDSNNTNNNLSKQLAARLIDELLKDGYEITEDDFPNLLMAAKIAINSNKKNQSET